ncbi:MAG TPA: tRNA (adenosine(37)-N6)-threonylcarbamoyltransferase complex transferase subunit TsaD [Ignavibacteria bacterium]|nr:tRNA (adenosine(37)-N6)-threonylcarbamoyltransferase complex transferase subunit TsaD [Ignavibacteria bacterium]HMR39077.1 tRNA (adenosine(37)-N6)-threonylcarbamoyltransferase complex transferase subunit TsaD [Ignavibacteria bacterium]
MITLAIETSCDETSASVLENEKVLSNVISSQLFHTKFGGVVPEVASREHLKKITEITDEALKRSDKKLIDMELICATSEPGLIGALLIGLNFGKTISAVLDVPFVPVNHIQAHLYSNFLSEQKAEFPFLGLIISGGHTLLILAEDFFKHKIIGSTVDDAAGEAYDKTAKLLGLEYPGGKQIDDYSKKGNKDFHRFPIPQLKNNEFDFSFSGIKTAVLYFLRDIDYENKKDEKLLCDICASFQETMIKTLFDKTLKAAKKYKVKNIAVSGGVSANSGLRERFYGLKKNGYNVYFPCMEYSTDNAAMIGLTGFLKYKYSENKEYFKLDSLAQKAYPKLNYSEF